MSEFYSHGAFAAALALALSALGGGTAHAQPPSENAVADAADAFGMVVDRESIGLYSAGNVRGFSPVQAGNVRIDGLYFDAISNGNLPARIVRSEVVYVGIAAQGYLFPAPTGVVDYQLRIPGNEAQMRELVGDTSHGEAYDETDAQIPIISDVLSMGAGIGYTRNIDYDYAPRSYEFNAGWIARWQPTNGLIITPFWGMTHGQDFGERASVIIGDSGYPLFRADRLPAPPWALWGAVKQNVGATAHYSFGAGWRLAAGLFRSLQYTSSWDDPLLLQTNGLGQGIFALAREPADSKGATSGEVRLSKRLDTGPIHNAFYVHVTGRDSSIESGGAQTPDLELATTTYLPPLPRPELNVGQNTDVIVHQLTPGVAYAGSWPGHAQLTLGVQRVYYGRTVMAPDTPALSERTSALIYNAAGAASLSHQLLLYASYTRGFEEVGTAPANAVNRFQSVPAQLDTQVDAGFRYHLLPRLQLVADVFDIIKPYFNLDQFQVFRLLGTTSNRGVEFSLTGDLTSRLRVVSGIALIQPRVQYTPGALPGPSNVVAIGPIPGYSSTYFQYHPQAVPGLILGTTIQITSSQYAVYPNIDLPSVITIGADVRYQTKLFDRNATFWLRGYNLSNVYSLSPSASGQLQSLDGRGFELSLEAHI